MKNFTSFVVTALAVWSLTGTALAKQTLPVSVGCSSTGPTSATVRVQSKASATALTVTVGGTGSVVMDEVTRHSHTTSASQQITVPVTFTSGAAAGGLVVEVRGDFGQGMKSQIQTFTLVEGPQSGSADVRARTNSGAAGSPEMVIVPAKTSTEKR